MPTKTFTGTIGRTYADTDFSFDVESNLPPTHPNVVYIVLDDTGFASFGSYGNTVVRTPHIDALAADGLRYNNFHTTAICSATRASLLTGANHHKAGVNAVIESENGLANGRGTIDPAYATLAEILHEDDYATAAFGKWHLSSKQTQAGPFDGWPLQKGFDRYYGTLRAMGDQFHPVLTQDNTFVPQPAQPDAAGEGYHFSEDIVDHAIRYVSEQANSYPDQPFFVYLAFGAQHAPFHAPKSYIDAYKGAFDEGWDVLRERWFENQKRIGIIPADAELTPRNEDVPVWDSLTPDEQRLYARYAEVFAGFLTHTDEQIGRFVDYLKRIGRYDDTLIVLISDNGASSEGGARGKFNQLDMSDAPLNRLLKSAPIRSDLPRDYERALAHIDEIGGEFSQPHYPQGWANAFNAPFPWYKVWTFEGGTRDSLIITYPDGIKDAGGIRDQYTHVSDITPTVLEVLGAKKPEIVKGVHQEPFTGTPFAYTFDDADAVSRKRVQYYEIWGNRSIYKDGWVAVVNHIAVDGDYSRDVWELYHTDADFSEAHDVAAEYPEKLRELQDEFLIQAAENHVFPMLEIKRAGSGSPSLDPLASATSGGSGSDLAARLKGEAARRTRVFRGVVAPIDLPETLGVDIDRSAFTLTARVQRRPGGQGAIFSTGDRFGGWALFVLDGRLGFAYNDNVETYEVVADAELPEGEVEVGLAFEPAGEGARARLEIAGEPAGELEIAHRNSINGWGTYIGADPHTAVSGSYEAPFAFEGEIDELVIEQGVGAGAGAVDGEDVARARASHVE